MLPLLLLALGCAPPDAPSPPSPDPAFVLPADVAPAWPAVGARLHPPEVIFPTDFGVRRVVLDPGHGRAGNHGTTAVDCEREQAHALRVARHLADALEATGHFEIRLARTDHQGPSYRARIEEAERWGAEALISVHADARGAIYAWEPEPGRVCPRNDDQTGFSVLVSDRTEEPLRGRRLALARAVAERMAQAGLLPYDGWDYGGLYEADPTPGVFLDRRGLLMLRAPALPAVLVETHHALSLEEHARWREEATWDALAASLGAALVDVLQASGRRNPYRRPTDR